MQAPETTLLDGFLSSDEASELYRRLLAEVHWDERMKARKTACFGETYDDSGVDYEMQPMHPLIDSMLGRISEELGFRPTNCLLNYYPDGDSTMGFHSDATYNLAPGTGIGILSLGSERELTFRAKTDHDKRVGIRLQNGSLFHMTQETQDHWQHAVKKAPGARGRISVTLRHIVPRQSPDQIQISTAE
jgi:alkylated DNA repair dioxygenase AlkB